MVTISGLRRNAFAAIDFVDHLCAHAKMSSFDHEPLLLWSASNRIKHMVGRIYGYHYIWCSPVFDGKALGRLALGAGQPPSSNPLSIYRNLQEAVQTSDAHSNEIRRQRETIKAVALKLFSDGVISEKQTEEVVALVDAASIPDWRPLMYVIPYEPVRQRVQLVSVGARASLEPEYIIPDLKDEEFQVIEF